jgi:transcriptional regulator with XRE-family HTH domain
MPYKVEVHENGDFAVTVEPGTPSELRVHGRAFEEPDILCPAKLAEYLRHLRDKTGERVSIKTVCESTGLSTGYYWRIEAGEVKQPPGMATLRKLANYFEVGTDSLIALSGARSVAELYAEQAERAQDSMEVVFTRMVLHKQLKPAGLSADDLGWVPEKLQHAWVDFAKRLALALTDNPDALDELLSKVES